MGSFVHFCPSSQLGVIVGLSFKNHINTNTYITNEAKKNHFAPGGG
jgi:hypothetical protein